MLPHSPNSFDLAQSNYLVIISTYVLKEFEELILKYQICINYYNKNNNLPLCICIYNLIQIVLNLQLLQLDCVSEEIH